MSNDKMLALRGRRAVWAPVPRDTGPIDPSRLPEGYPYKEQATVTFCEGADIAFSYDSEEAYGYSTENVDLLATPIVGEKYTVIFDDVECTDVLLTGDPDYCSLLCFEDGQWVCRVTFEIYSDTEKYVYFSAASDAATHSVKVTGPCFQYNTIEPKYLPQAVLSGESVDPDPLGAVNRYSLSQYILRHIPVEPGVTARKELFKSLDNQNTLFYVLNTDGNGRHGYMFHNYTYTTTTTNGQVTNSLQMYALQLETMQRCSIEVFYDDSIVTDVQVTT